MKNCFNAGEPPLFFLISYVLVTPSNTCGTNKIYDTSLLTSKVLMIENIKSIIILDIVYVG